MACNAPFIPPALPEHAESIADAVAGAQHNAREYQELVEKVQRMVAPFAARERARRRATGRLPALAAPYGGIQPNKVWVEESGPFTEEMWRGLGASLSPGTKTGPAQ